MNRAAGITLLELLVVVAIISVLAVAASLSLGRGTGLARGGGDAQIVEEAYRTAWRAAVLEGRDHALLIGAETVQIEQRIGDTWEATTAAQPLRFIPSVAPGPGTERIDGTGAARLVILASGRGSAAEIEVRNGDRTRLCRADGATPLTCGSWQ